MRFIFTLLLGGLLHSMAAQPLYFPPLTGDAWETLAPESIGWCQEKLDSLADFVEEHNTKSFIILKDGKIVQERYFGTYTADSIWYWASAGKSLMGALIGLAQQDGDIDLDSPVSAYMGEGWTECPPDKEALITIRNQISMSTGLDDSIEESVTSNCFDPACFQYLADAGTRWAYHNAPYRFLLNIMESIIGLDFNIYTRIRLGNRIGMKGFWFNYVYFSRARDMARFGLFMQAGGQWGSDVIFSDTDYFNAMTQPSQPHNPAYGYLWWLNGQDFYLLPGFQVPFNGSLVPEAPADMYAALGLNDQKIYVVPSQGLVIVRQGESAGGVNPTASSFDRQLWARLSDLDCAVSAQSPSLAEANWTAFPNPAREQLWVEGPAAVRQLRLMNAHGQLARQSANSNQLALNGLPAGLYWLWADFEDGQRGVRKVQVR